MTGAAEGVELPQLSEVIASRERSSTSDRQASERSVSTDNYFSKAENRRDVDAVCAREGVGVLPS
jgi:hypothetical protein